MMRDFIAISTGQNIANIAPLLACASRDDRIWFLTSKKASTEDWTQRAFSVLRSHGLHASDVVLESDEPADLWREAKKLGRSLSAACVIVGNGGAKLQAMALRDALSEMSPVLLYSVEQRCELQWYQEGTSRYPQVHPYGATPLTLDDVVGLSGARLAHTPEQLYAAGELTEPGQILSTFDKGYGFEEAPTLEFHLAHHHHALARGEAGELRLPRWDSICVHAEDSARKFARSVSSALGLSPNALQTSDQRVATLFNSAVKAVESLRSRMAVKDRPILEPIGPLFEQALCARLCKHLRERYYEPLQGVWRNVRIEDTKEPGKVRIEADLLFLLKNGLLVAIEAKSHSAETKDLDARLTNLQRSASQLARIWVVSPIYTAAANQPWFAVHHELRQRVISHGMEHLPFTMPGQPAEYSWPPNHESKAIYKIPELESSFERLMNKWEARPSR